MTSVAASSRGQLAAPTRTLVDRAYAALPLALAFVWLCLLYAWESWGHRTPWLFGDELNLAQISRSIAETGEPARRGEPYGFQTLYSYLIAPAWWFDDAHRAYSTIKYIGVLTMTSAIFPAYALARMLVSRPAALFAATATVSIPALVYSPMLMAEPLAYPYATLCFFLVVKALATRSPRWLAAAAVASAVAPAVRGQLALVPTVFALAAGFLFWHGARMRSWRRSWSAGDWIGAFALAIGALIVFNTLIGDQSTTFDVATGHYKQRMWLYGIWAAGALAIGLGILPLVAGLAALFRPRDESRSAELRAFLAVTAAAIVCFGLYTAIKAAYLSTVFATRIEERNLIYLAPLLLIGTALWLDRPRLRWLPLAAAGGFALYLILRTPYQLETRLSVDTPGLSILSLGNRELAFDATETRLVLLGALAVSFALVLALRFVRHRGAAAGVGGLACAVVLAWSLAGQIAASNSSNAQSDAFLSGLRGNTDWIDEVTGGAPTMYLGQNITDPNGIWSLEFWNRSIKYVWSLDGTAPGPGPTATPNIDEPNGHLEQQRGELKYVVVDPGIDVVGDVRARAMHLEAGQPAEWRLVEIDYPVRLRTAQEGIYSDGWMGKRASYTVYTSSRKKGGAVVVDVSRAAWGGVDVPGRVTVRVGALALGADRRPKIGTLKAERRCTLRAHRSCKFIIPAGKPPVRAEVRISPTFVPAELDPRMGDRRELGGVVGFGFSERPELR